MVTEANREIPGKYLKGTKGCSSKKTTCLSSAEMPLHQSIQHRQQTGGDWSCQKIMILLTLLNIGGTNLMSAVQLSKATGIQMGMRG